MLFWKQWHAGCPLSAKISVVSASIPERTAQCFAKRRSEEHTSELQSQSNLVCRLLLEKKNSTADQPTVEDTFLLRDELNAKATPFQIELRARLCGLGCGKSGCSLLHILHHGTVVSGAT